MLELAKKFNPLYFRPFTAKGEEQALDVLTFFDYLVRKALSLADIDSFEDSIKFYESFLYAWAKSVVPDDIDSFETSFVEAFKSDFIDDLYEPIPEASFKGILANNWALSVILFGYIPYTFIPNFFVMQFNCLKEFAKEYEMELMETPKRAEYLSRNFYYLDMSCNMLNFAAENELTPAELCAFLYGYSLPVIKEEKEQESKTGIPEHPEQAWFLVGNYHDGEKNMQYGFWQANELTTKGDVLVFFEKSPVKAINSVWTAQEDGTADPFFFYYSNTYIGNKIDIPAISFEELKLHPYFQNHSLIRKKFQGGSGWPMTYEDYRQFKLILQEKGFDTSVLPSMYEPTKYITANVMDENDVYEKLVTPMLNDMGWVLGRDFEREVEFPAGHTQTGHSSKKRPDYCLHITRKSDGDISARVVIEAKEFMKNDKAIIETFKQARSYAKWGKSKVMVICDKTQIRVYELDKNEEFDLKKYKRFRWEEIEQLDKRNELKNLLK